MELSNKVKLSNEILCEPNNRYCEIYKIQNILNNKVYIGQAVSHILNHKKFRPYGRKGRFRCHISEAFSTKKNQCHYLNNSIRKYGVEKFDVELVECCECVDACKKETFYIAKFNSLFPYGYNLKNGGNVFTHTPESKRRVSNGVVNYYKDKKKERFVGIHHIDDDIEKYIRPLNRKGEQYGWYVRINKCKTDFGGVHIDLNDSYKNAEKFIYELKENLIAKHLDAGNSLES
jgi:group I intron endonuclease